MFRQLLKCTSAIVMGLGLAACSILYLPGSANDRSGDGHRSQARGLQGPGAREHTFSQPPLSVSAEQAVSLGAAYRQQRSAVLQALGEHSPSGFKAGLTTTASQQRFSLNEPIAGVLWPDSPIVYQGSPAIIRLSQYRRPMLEVELAFRVNALIPEPLADVSEVRHVISEVMPAIELPDLGFESAVGVTGEAVVAANAGARYFLIGAARPVAQVDVNAIRATLSFNGTFQQRAEATQVMGSQWRALYWLINKMVGEGWVIQPGQILLTGAMGEMLPLQEGVYQASFAGLGEISLQVEQ
ncbi:MAG: 2-keto-4-pentenoate hydratase [Bermanella sp.]